MNDLIKENQRLQAELDVLTKKYQKVQLLFNQQNELNKRTQDEFTKLLNTVTLLNTQADRVEVLEKLNSQLKHENERLQGTYDALKLKYDELTAQKPTKLRRELTDIVSARILSCYIVKEDVETVREYLKEKYAYDIAIGKVYRTISVVEPQDFMRIMTLYRTYKEEFKISEEELNNWFVVKRIKKLKLMSEMELTVKYGPAKVKEILPTIEEDEYAKGYYSQEAFK